MTTENFIDYAKSFGYDVRYTGIGMAYLTVNDAIITDVADTEKINGQLALIGMAIMQDTLRKNCY